MNLAFALYKYFPFGGLQRDCIAIARACVASGARVRVYALQWQGDVPEGVEVYLVSVRGLTNHARYARFHRELQRLVARDAPDVVVGFNKMPGLDIYYAADSCFAERVVQHAGWYRHTPRARHFLNAERSVFGTGSAPQILLLSETHQQTYMRHYGTDASRMHVLPPGIARDRMAAENALELRKSLRDELAIGANEYLVLLIGSGFVTKGLDRALRAVAALPSILRDRVQFVAVGEDAPGKFLAMAKRLGISGRVRILPGRSDVPRLLQGADLLIHPAHVENTGTVLLEAVVAGLPVLTLDVCGFAPYVQAANAGVVLPSPFDQQTLNTTLTDMLIAPERDCWRANGIAFGKREALYNMPEAAAAIIGETVAMAVARRSSMSRMSRSAW